MLTLEPVTVQMLAVLVLVGPLLYGVRKLRQFRERPRFTDRGYIVGRDQFRSERKAVLHELQRGRFTQQPVEHARATTLSGSGAKGFRRVHGSGDAA